MPRLGGAAMLTRRQSPSQLLTQLALLMVFAAAAPRVSAQAWIANQIATSYGSAYDKLSPWQPSFGTKEGSCGFGLLDKTEWPYWSVAGISVKSPFYIAGPLHACGQCFEVQCVNNKPGSPYAGNCYANSGTNSVIVTISDSCPECAANHLDMAALAFGRLAPIVAGRIDTRIRRVNCSPPAGMAINVMNGATGSGFFKFTVQGVSSIGSVKRVEVAGAPPANARVASAEGAPQWTAATPVINTPQGQLAATQDALLASALAPKDPALPQNNGNGTQSIAGAAGAASGVVGRRRSLQGGPSRALAAAAFDNTYTNYGAAWQLNQMPPPPLSFRVTLSNNQIVTTTNAVSRQQLALGATLPLNAQFPSSTPLRAGAASIGSGRYGDKNPYCPVGQFYDTQAGRVPACRACIGFAWNLDKTLGCYPPQMDAVQKNFCGPLPMIAYAMDKGDKLACFNATATIHTVLLKIPATNPFGYTYTHILPKVFLRSKSQTLLVGTKVQQTSKGSLVTFQDPSRKVGQLMANRKLRQDFLYVEGIIKKGSTAQPMCFSSDQNAAMRVC